MFVVSQDFVRRPIVQIRKIVDAAEDILQLFSRDFCLRYNRSACFVKVVPLVHPDKIITFNAVPCSQHLQERPGFLQLGKELFFGLELRAVDTAAAASQLHRVLEVQHLVINDVLHGVTGN